VTSGDQCHAIAGSISGRPGSGDKGRAEGLETPKARFIGAAMPCGHRPLKTPAIAKPSGGLTTRPITAMPRSAYP
jgi:hypothetical protein